MPLDLKALNGSTWICEPERLRAAVARVAAIPTCPTGREIAAYRRERLDYFRQLAQAAEVSRKTDRQIEEEFTADQQLAAKGIRGVKGKVGVIPVHGPIQQRMSSELMKTGGTSTEEVGLALDAMLADKTIGAIVLHTDSPGGSSFGVEELSDKIFQARGRKPIYAIADSMAASAGFWVASAADQLLVTNGGEVGSVGVYMLHIDESAALEAEGVKVTAVHAGKFKVEGAPWLPLGEEGTAHWQGIVNETYGKFVSALARNRDTSTAKVRSDFGEGRVVTAGAAVKAGMVDRVMTYEQLMGKLLAAPGEPAGKSAAVLRLRHQLAKVRGA